MTLRSSDLQSKSDLDSIHNSCDILISLDWTFLGCSIFEEEKKIKNWFELLVKRLGHLDVASVCILKSFKGLLKPRNCNIFHSKTKKQTIKCSLEICLSRVGLASRWLPGEEMAVASSASARPLPASPFPALSCSSHDRGSSHTTISRLSSPLSR